MSLYGVMRTGVSGMNAQTNRLSVVADNVANVNTTGYKASSCEFSSLLLSGSDMNYECGSVLTAVRHHIDAQGSLAGTSSLTDLAIQGSGFFIVSDPGGASFLTRAGSFVPDAEGKLVNAGGFTLMGFPLTDGKPDPIINSTGNLMPVDLDDLPLAASPSTKGRFTANLPSAAEAVDLAKLPSLNGAETSFTAKSSMITYDKLGAEVKLDIYFTKKGEDQWEVAVFDGRDAASGGGFPYASGPLETLTVQFGDDGQLTAGGTHSMAFGLPGGVDFTLDLSGSTQLAADYSVRTATADGMPAGDPDRMEITAEGVIYGIYGDGTRVPLYQIPLAQVASPNQLTPLAGNVYTTSAQSGAIEIGFAQTEGFGTIRSAMLEQSTVDLAGQLTQMIDAQRSYTANSKVFQTGSELMDVLVNLKR
jgi:flagellar hook protein FlgE